MHLWILLPLVFKPLCINLPAEARLTESWSSSWTCPVLKLSIFFFLEIRITSFVALACNWSVVCQVLAFVLPSLAPPEFPHGSKDLTLILQLTREGMEETGMSQQPGHCVQFYRCSSRPNTWRREHGGFEGLLAYSVWVECVSSRLLNLFALDPCVVQMWLWALEEKLQLCRSLHLTSTIYTPTRF